MKQFFNKILFTFQTLFNEKANAHQQWMVWIPLLIGLLFSTFMGTIPTVLLMLVGGTFAEFSYCFVPTRSFVWKEFWIRLPDYKEFYNNKLVYFLKPMHLFDIDNLYYPMVSAFIFIMLKILMFLCFL